MGKPIIRVTEIGMGMRCQMALYLKRKIGPRPPSGAMMRGTSVHKAMEVNFIEKFTGGIDAPLDVCTDAFRDTFHERLLDTDFRDDEPPKEMFSQGISMVKAIHREVCPPIYPRSLDDIERTMRIDCGDFIIQGTTDLRDVLEKFWDWKGAARRWAATKAVKEVQGFLYPLGVMLEDGIPPLHENEAGDKLVLPFTFVVATKKGEIQLCPVHHRMEAAKALITMARRLVKMLKTETPIANNDSFLCSPKWCAYMDFCPVMRGAF